MKDGVLRREIAGKLRLFGKVGQMMYVRAAAELLKLRQERFGEAVVAAKAVGPVASEMLISAYEKFSEGGEPTRREVGYWCDHTPDGNLFTVSYSMRAACPSGVTDGECEEVFDAMVAEDSHAFESFQLASLSSGLGRDIRSIVIAVIASDG